MRHLVLAGALSLVWAAGPAYAQHETAFDVEEGGRAFRNSCANGHGPDGDEIQGIDLGRGQFTRPSTDTDLIRTIRQGIPGTPMPPSPNMSEEQAARMFDPRTLEKKWEFKMSDITWAGVLTTATDVLFSGGKEGYFFALDARDGSVLRKASLGGQINSGPMSYSVNGRQYITVAAGNSLFAYALRQ